MTQGLLVLCRKDSVSVFLALITKLIEIVRGFAINPRTAEEARSLPFELADDLPAAHTIVDERVLCSLTIADLALFSRLDLAQVPLLQLIDLLIFSCLLALSVGSPLLLLSLLVEFTLSLDPLHKFLDECLDLLLCRVEKTGEVVEDRVLVL